ncbi:hypothetical protein [Bradyrhizobium sp. NAS96.2]|uniref:hypothetical protein n=1 Tax=Bradyrhizobium sp. NAS96.2 TaxID=1680160 RepID=UPI00093A9E3C|nr:hypothetical protein [Bradyrhizobium sp. NAS96.2]OKO78074.1 hypothetical protein AC628_14225 [Bradyrhizobium sp. NAS96.2]
MITVSRSQQQMIDNYSALMDEVKERIEWLNVLLAGSIKLPNPALQEFGFLQLRILCELIALACLTAHGEIPEVKGKRLHEEWNATNILKRLEHLHSDFYPKPITVTNPMPGHAHIDFVISGFLTKTDLISLYGRSGDLLHRGSVSKLLEPTLPWPPDMQEITEWGHKIVNLLRDHSIGHLGGQSHILCKLSNPQDFGKVQVAFATALTAEVEFAIQQAPRRQR